MLSQKFLAALSVTTDWLESNVGDYFVVGSIAASAFIGSRDLIVRAQRAPGRLNASRIRPDIDVILPRNRYKEACRAWHMSWDKTPPLYLDLFSSISHLDFKQHDAFSSLTHRYLDIPFPTLLLDSRLMKVDGVDIRTVDPMTLLHFYEVLGGVIREKDLRPIEKLTNLTRGPGSMSQFVDADFAGFEHFCKFRAEMFPGYIAYRSLATKLRGRLPESLQDDVTILGRHLQPFLHRE
jgi:hypothetical protein